MWGNHHTIPISTPIPITTIPIPITTILTLIPTPPKLTTNDSDSDSDSRIGVGIVESESPQVWYVIWGIHDCYESGNFSSLTLSLTLSH